MSTALAAAKAMAAATSSAAPAATTLSNTTTTNHTTNTTIVTATASPATNTSITNTAKSTPLEPAAGMASAAPEEYLPEEQVPPELVDHSLESHGHQLILQSAPKPRRQRRTTVVHTCPRPPGGYRYSMEFLYGIGSCMAGTTLNIATPLSITPRNVRTAPPSLTTRMPLLTTMGMPASPRPMDSSLPRNRYAIGVVTPGSPGGLTAVTAAVPASSTTTTSPGSSAGSPSTGSVITTGSTGNLPTAQFIYQGYLPSGPQRRLWHAENAFWQFDRNYPYNQGYASQYGIPMMPVGFEHPYGSQRIIYPGYYSQATGPFHAAPVPGMPRVSRHVTTNNPQQQQQQHSAAQQPHSQQPHPVTQQPAATTAAAAGVSGEASEEPNPPAGNGQNMGATWRHAGPGAQGERRQPSAPGSAAYHRESKSYYNSGTGGGSRFKPPFDQQPPGGGNARNHPAGAAPGGAGAGAAPAASAVGSSDQNSSNQSRNYQGSGSNNNNYAKCRHHGKRGGKHAHGKDRTSNSSGSLSASSSKSHLGRGASSNTSLGPPKHPNRSYRNRFRYLNGNEAADRKSVIPRPVPVASYQQQQPQPPGMRRLPKFQGANAYQGHLVEGGKPVVSRQQSRYYQSRHMDAYVYQPGHYMLYATGAAPLGLGGGMPHPGQGGMAMGPGGGAGGAGGIGGLGGGVGGGGGGVGIAGSGSGSGGGGGGAATATASSATSEGEQPLDSDFDQCQDYTDLGLDPAHGGFSSDLEPLGFKQDTSEMDAHSCLLSHHCSEIEITDAQSIASAAPSTTPSQDSDTTESDLSGASVESVVRKIMVSCLAIATGAEVPDLNGPNLVPYGDMHHLMELEFQSQPAMTNGYRSAKHQPHQQQPIHQRMRGISCCGDMLCQASEEMAYKLEQEQQQQQQQEDALEGAKCRCEEADYISVESSLSVSPSASSSKSAEASLSARTNTIMPKKESPEDGLPQDMHNRYWREFFGYTPADRFLLRAKLVEVKRPPRTVPSSTKWESLSLCIWRKFLEAQQTRHIYKTKMRLWRYIYTVAMDGQRGHLEGLASVYCELLMAPFGDILSAIERARQAAWAERSPLHGVGAQLLGGGGGGSGSGAGGSTGSGSGGAASGGSGGSSAGCGAGGSGGGSVGISLHHRQQHGHRGHSMHGAGLPNSHSQPIYVPGKYSPSSCLSDKEEDEIYGFGYGVFAPRVARGGLTQQQQLLQQQTLQTQQNIQQMQMQQQQQQQQQLPIVPGQPQQAGPHQHQTLPPNVAHMNFVQQNCLSPRSAYFYEFPPTAEGRETKKRTTLARLLKGLKTVNRRDRNNQQNGAQARAANDRLRHFQMINGGAGGQQHSFEETIHRLKVQEAMRKKEKFQREHEEILRDIRQGLLQMSRGEGRMDDTYMYDEALRTGVGMGIAGLGAIPMGVGGGGGGGGGGGAAAHYAVSALHHQGHWYDEPPYESDPDDFLMAGLNCGPAATIQGGRVRFSNNRESTGVISLRSAGDISLPQRGPPRRGLIVPQQPPNPPTIIPLTHARSHDRESGDYAGSISDLQSVTSRLSAVSIGTNNCTARYRTLSGGIGESPSLSPSPSSDYEDIGATRGHGCLPPSLLAAKAKKNGLPHGKANTICQKATVHHSGEMRSSAKEIGAFNENGRNFVATKDTSRDFSNSQDNTDRGSMSDQAFACSASSVESLPSASGSSTQALVRPGSPHSSISAEDRTSMASSICKAKALVDSLPNPYDKEALKFKKGELIDVLSMNASGIWKGRCHGRVGHFKFINVEVLPEQRMKNSSSKTLAPGSRLANNPGNGTNNGGGPCSVEDLLIRIGLKEYTSVFVLNGYEDLELFKELEPADLDYLGILNQEHRAKLLTAVQLLHDIECSDVDIAGSSSENDEARLNNINIKHGASPFGRRHFPRDSGCYEGSPLPSSQTPTQAVNSTDESNSLDDVVTKCSSEIMKRVESARRCKDNPFKATLPGGGRVGKKSFLGGGGLMADDTLTRGGLSEKSSDSGVSSSSLSSGPLKSST